MEHIIIDGQGIMSKAELRKLYADYCKDHSLSTESDKVIKRVLEENYGASDGRSSESGWNYDWNGIRYKKVPIYDGLRAIVGLSWYFYL